MNYRDLTLGDWIEHINGKIEDETTLDGNEMRDLVKFLTTMQEPKADYRVKTELNGIKTELEPCEDCISRKDALDCMKAVGLKKFDFILDARNKIKNLPSKICNPVKTELEQEQNTVVAENAAAVLEQINCWIGSGEYRHTNATDYLTRRIKELPFVTPKEPKTEPCDDCISRKAVLNIIDNYSNSQSNVEDVTQDCISDVIALPSVQPKTEQEPKTGHWIDSSNGWMCSECKRDSRKDTDYCPNCGAKMESDG